MGVEPITPILQGSVAGSGMQAQSTRQFAAISFQNWRLKTQLQVPVSNWAHRPYESQLSTCSPAVTRAGFEPASLA
jgi:hypothetical protein